MSMQRQQGAKADMIYGETGSTKTSRLGDAAEYIMRRYAKRSRLVSADPGGWEPIQSLIDDGTVEAFALVPERKNLIEAMQKLTQGWWPANVNDPQSELKPPAMAEVGCVMFESATSWCGLMLQTYAGEVQWNEATKSISATNVRVPEMPKDSFIKSGSYVRRFFGRSDYGGVQSSIAEFIRNSGMLPVHKVIWTALETQGKDEAKRPVYGPDFAGQALTGVCGPWFGNLLHLDFVPQESTVQVGGKAMKVVKPQPFLFLRNHIDPADQYGLVYPAKVRAPRTLWSKVPDSMEPRLDKLYDLLDSLAAEEAAARTAVVGVK